MRGFDRRTDRQTDVDSKTGRVHSQSHGENVGFSNMRSQKTNAFPTEVGL